MLGDAARVAFTGCGDTTPAERVGGAVDINVTSARRCDVSPDRLKCRRLAF